LLKIDNHLASMLQGLVKINPLRPLLALISNFWGVEKLI